jgi:hypothetical protein
MKLLREITAGLVLWGFSLALLSSSSLNLGAVRNIITTILRAPTNQKAGTTRLTGNRKLAEKEENPMTVAENKAVISSFLEEVLNQGRLERVDDLVAVDFVEVDPFPGQKQGAKALSR